MNLHEITKSNLPHPKMRFQVLTAHDVLMDMISWEDLEDTWENRHRVPIKALTQLQPLPYYAVATPGKLNRTEDLYIYISFPE